MRVRLQPKQTLGTLVRDRAQSDPDRPLLRFAGEEMTYGTFDAGANAFAAVLRSAGVGREPVAIMMENSPTLLMAQVAAAKTGAVAALINTHLSGAALSHALRSSQARHVFTDAACLPRAAAPPESASLTLWGQGDPAQLPPHVEPLDAALAAAPRQEPADVGVRASDPFLYMFTAGTTGTPRPTQVSHGRYLAAGSIGRVVFAIRADDVVYAPLPLYHAQSNFLGFAVAVAAGGVFASRRRFQAAACLEDLVRHQATVLVYTGELGRYLVREPQPPADRMSLRLAIGSGLRPDVWDRFRRHLALEQVIEIYGQTESNVCLVDFDDRPESVGRPLPGLNGTIRLARTDVATGELLRDDDGLLTVCADGEVGELLQRMESRSLIPDDGPVERARLAPRIVSDAFRRGDRWLRSGDLLRRNEDGTYAFVDRARDAFVCRGTLVTTLAVGEALTAGGEIDEACVFAVTVPGRSDHCPMAVVVPAPQRDFSADAFYASVQSLPEPARPLFVRVTARIDVTGVLTHRKAELQRQGYDPTRMTDAVYVRDDAAGTFVPLTPERLDQIRRGAWVVSTSAASL